MNYGNDIKSPSMQRSKVLEKRMQMLAALLDKFNGGADAEQQQEQEETNDRKRGNKKSETMTSRVAGIFFHRVK
ncbi:hypothetical protein [Paenibacillus sp. NPDC058071]|uniref:hypothetical protein n=1 Tax=Paenibacillus sp. NPDC058071 TaxID=3346326 RepID=UPI0036D91EC7